MVKPIFERTKETDEHFGWVFPSSSTEEAGAEPDHLNGAKSVRELYEIGSSNYSGRYSVPVRIYMISWFLVLLHLFSFNNSF